MSKTKALIVGGTSGLGLEIAKQLQLENYKVYVAGRNNPQLTEIEFFEFHLYNPDEIKLARFVESEGPFEIFVYAAGYYQKGSLPELTNAQIEEMIGVGLMSPAKFLRKIIQIQKYLGCFVAITSTSQWTPRFEEPIYTAVKAGLGMLAQSLSLDPNVGKVLVAAPAGMKTNFWKGTDKDTSDMLDPTWVAERIVDQLADDSQYKFVKILRNPARVEVVETRFEGLYSYETHSIFKR